jgi:hypothetical protein
VASQVARKFPDHKLFPWFFQFEVASSGGQVSWIVVSAVMFIIGIVLCLIGILQTRRPPKRNRTQSTQPDPSFDNL